MIRKIIFILAAFYFLGATCGVSFSQGEKKIEPILVHGDIVEFLPEEKSIKAEGNVTIEYKDVKIEADEAYVDTKGKTVHLKGNVRIDRDGSIIKAEEIEYNLEDFTGEVKEVTGIEYPPFYGKVESAQKISDSKYKFSNGYITTSDLDKPHYRLSAKSITLYPKKKVVAKNVIMYVGCIPVLYIPYYVQPLWEDMSNVSIMPGKDGYWGYYLLTGWRYHINEDHKGTLHLDYRENQDFSPGVDYRYQNTPIGEGDVRLYYVHDDAKLHSNPEDRYRAQLRHELSLGDAGQLRAEMHKFSDRFFMKDFFYREYEIEQQPLSYVDYQKNFYNSFLSLLFQKRINRFYTQTEYLPRFLYQIQSIPVGETSIYYNSDNSVSYLRRKNSAPSDYNPHTMRIDTDQELIFESKIFSFLYIAPYVGGRETYYSRDALGNREFFKGALTSGVDTSFRLYRTWDAKGRYLGIELDRLRHIFKPKISYEYVHTPTTSNNRLVLFDSVDSWGAENKVSPGFESILETKRNGSTYKLTDINAIVDYQLRQREKSSFWDEGRIDIEFYPYNYLSFYSDARYDFPSGVWGEFNTDIRYSPEPWGISIGYRYIRDDNQYTSQLENNSQLTSQFNWTINPKWAVSTYHRYEFDDNNFQEQQYKLSRDLHSWLMDLIVEVDRSREVTFWIAMKLKAFPDLGFSFETSYHGPEERD